MSSLLQGLSASTILLVGLFSSGSALAGKQFGDPIPFRVAHSYQTYFTTFSVHVTKLKLTPCGGGTITHHTVGYAVSPTVGVEPPLGCWEEVVVVFGSDFTLSGQTPTNYSLSVTLDVAEVSLVMMDDLNITTGASTEEVIFELHALDWYEDEVRPYVSSSAPVTITPQHGRHSAVVANMENGSAMLLAPL